MSGVALIPAFLAGVYMAGVVPARQHLRPHLRAWRFWAWFWPVPVLLFVIGWCGGCAHFLYRVLRGGKNG